MHRIFPDINFSLLSTANGLPTNLITALFKDSRGLIWLGTENDGLLRYDGKKAKSFHSSVYPGGISSNYVGDICEDKKGWLWICTLDGLYHINPVTEKIEIFQHAELDKNSLATNVKPHPFVDSKGRIWVSSTNGLQQFNLAENNFINYTVPPITNPAWQEHAKEVGLVFEDSKNRLWAGSAYGIYLIDTATHKLHPHFTGFYIGVTNIYEDKYQQIWVSFWGGGLKKFNPENGKFTDVINDNIIQHIGEWEDENKKNWLYFYNNNIFTLYDPITNHAKAYPTDETRKNSIKGKYTTDIYNDKKGNLWISTDAGINIIDRKAQYFKTHLLSSNLNTTNTSDFGEPKALLVQSNRFFLSAWYRRHLYVYDQNWNLKEKIKSVPPSSAAVLSQSIYTIQNDTDGNIWYGTDSGLVKQTANNYTCYLPQDSFPSLELRYAARNILKRNDGLFWSRFANRGVYIFDAAKGKFTKNYRHQFKGKTTCMEYDKTGKLWLGTDEGLYYYQQSSDSFIRFSIKQQSEVKYQYYNNIQQIYFDNNNTGWIATYYGLLKISNQSDKAAFIVDKLNPKNYMALRILQDANGTFWIRSGTNIIAYDEKINNFRYFSSVNGLTELSYGFAGVFNWLPDNTIAIGTGNTITTFNPYLLTKFKNSSNLLFTDFVADGKRIITAADNKKELRIPAGSKNISIHFALLSNGVTQQNKLFYRIESKNDNNWNETNEGDIYLVNQPPGNYVL